MTFLRFLDLFSLYCSNGTSLSQLLFNSSKFLQLCRILSVLGGESWWFILLLASCFVKKLITLSFSNIWLSSYETRFVKILKQMSFSSELFFTDLTSGLIVNRFYETFEQLLYGFSVRCRFLNCSFVNYQPTFCFQNTI